jgi:uncharacterized protein (DUF488 family)
MSQGATIYTFGHGTMDEIELAALVRASACEAVVDVRSVPRSRAHPHVWTERMAVWVPDLSGASYEWRPALGGFRKPHADSANVGLRNPSFRGYADYMQSPEFAAALAQLVEDAGRRRTAIMCSETLWWRCHRRLVADALVLAHSVEVQHLMHAGAPQPHRLTPGARLLPEGHLQYDAA